MEHLKEFSLNGFKVVIDYDSFVENPRNWSESKWYGVDKNAPKDLIVDEDNYFNPNCDELKDKFWFKVYKYEHSEVFFSLYPVDKFDTSFNGVIAVPKSMFETREMAMSYIALELRTYSDWFNGYVYGCQIFDANGSEVDSCWSFFDIDQCEKEAREMVSALAEEREKESVCFWANNSD